jgi:hypothetical protein
MSSNNALSNRILITFPKSDECSCHGSWIYLRSFLKHLKEAHGYNQKECKALLGKAIMNLIENAVESSSDFDYLDTITKCGNKIVVSTNDRSSVPDVPKKGSLFYSEHKDLIYRNLMVKRNEEGINPFNMPKGSFQPSKKFIIYSLKTTGFWRDDFPPDLTDIPSLIFVLTLLSNLL